MFMKTNRLVLNKLYDNREASNSEIQYLNYLLLKFSEENNIEYNQLKWWEYAYFLLYSGHRHGSKVLDIGSAKSVFPYFLSTRGYDVTSIDIADFEYRKATGDKFGTVTLHNDIRYFNPEFENGFDLVTCSSVIEHVDKDTEAILNLGKYIKTGGIIAISSDFYKESIEYPDANRTLFPESTTDSRVYTPETFMERIIKPLEENGFKRQGKTDFRNIDINDPKEMAVRNIYTFGVSILRRWT